MSPIRPLLCTLAAVAVLAGAPLAQAGENPFKTESKPEPAKPVPKPAPAPKPAAKGPGGSQGRGSFKVAYKRVKDTDFAQIQKVFRETRILEDTAQALNEAFILPADVTITMSECGEANAFYEPEKRQITLCYELVSQFSAAFLADANSDQEQEDAGEAIAGATMFTLFHELGHALIHLYDLPVTGKEEDAVDQLATVILLEGGDEGENAALNGATSFLAEENDGDQDEEAELAAIPYWDEHSLGEQRFYNIICWTYGKNPDAYAELIEDGTLPEERAERCPGEYERIAKSWDTLLAQHMKD